MGKVYKRMFDAIEQLKATPVSQLPAARRGRNAMVKQAEDRWEYFDHPLHQAAYALDPEHQQHDWHSDPDIMEAIEDALERYYGDDTDAIAAAERQLEGYRRRQGRFARDSCVLNMKLMSGWSWWAKYGGKSPELQKVAMDILSLVAGACSCERNWSAFDFIHSKKRNKLSPAKAEELVYVFSNLRLLRRVTDANATELFYEWQSEGAAATAQGGTTATMQQSNEGLCDTESDLSEEVESELESDEISDDNDDFE